MFEPYTIVAKDIHESLSCPLNVIGIDVVSTDRIAKLRHRHAAPSGDWQEPLYSRAYEGSEATSRLQKTQAGEVAIRGVASEIEYQLYDMRLG